MSFIPNLKKMREDMARTPEVVAKWRRRGRLANVPADKEALIAWMLENQERHFKPSNSG